MHFCRNSTLFFVLTSCLLMVTEIDAQRRRNRKNNNTGDANFERCHTRELEACLNRLTNLVKSDDPGSVITTSAGIDLICKTIKDDTFACVKGYFQKCGTPLHREVSDLMMDFIGLRVDRFCNDEKQRSTLLSQTPCYQRNVFSSDEYKTGCNNKFLAAGDSVDTEHINVDTIHATLCCGYNTWYACTLELMEKNCETNGRKVFEEFSANTINRFTGMMCPLKVFGTQSDVCAKVSGNAVTADHIHNLGANVVTKYLLKLFPYLFVANKN